MAEQIEADIDQINYRFDVVKKQEFKQRKMIELSVDRLRRLSKLRTAFLCLKGRWEENKLLKKKARTATLKYLKNQKRKCFHFWRQVTDSECPKVKKLQKKATGDLDQLQSGYAAKIGALRARILEVEQKIQLVDQSTQFFANGISASYQQAIGVLSRELVGFLNVGEGAIIRPRTVAAGVAENRAVAERNVHEGLGVNCGGEQNNIVEFICF